MSVVSSQRLAAIALWLCVTFAARDSGACAACNCGDPTLVSAGTEQPFAGRLRLSAEWRHRTDAIGEPGIDRIEIRESRWEMAVAWAPLDNLFLVAHVPIVARSTRQVNLGSSDTWGPGDAELRAKAFVYRDRVFAPRWLIAATLGLKLPTAPFHRDSSGERLPLEAQAGTGSLDLLVGPSLATFHGEFSGYVSLQLSQPLLVRDDLVPGASLRSTLAGQWQATPWLAFRGASDLRADLAAREADLREPNSGGVVLFTGGDLLVSPAIDLTLSAGARFPTVEALRGAHAEGPVWTAAISYDL